MTRSPPAMAHSCCTPTPTAGSARADDSRPTANTTPRRRPRAGSRPGRPRSPQRTTPTSRPSWCSAASGPSRAGSSTARASRSPAPRAAVGRRADADRGPHRGRRPVPPARRPRRAGIDPRREGRLPALLCSRSTTGRGPSRSCWRARTSRPPWRIARCPPALPVEEEKALARRLIAPVAAKVLAGGNDDEKYRFLSDAAAIDPHAAIEWLARPGSAPPTTRTTSGNSWRRPSPARASTMRRPSSRPAPSANARADGYLGLVDVAPNLTAAPRARVPRTGPAQQQDRHDPGASVQRAGPDRRPVDRPG